MPRTRNRISGVISNDTPQREIDHPVLGKYLELIGDDDKPIQAELVSIKHAERIASDSKRADDNKEEE